MKTDSNHMDVDEGCGVKLELVSHPGTGDVVSCSETYSNFDSESMTASLHDHPHLKDDKIEDSDAALGDDLGGDSSMAVNLSAGGGAGSAHHNRDPPVFSSNNKLEVFKCVQCPYETYNLATLASHQKIHKLYQCDICQMKFSHAANMRRHRMRHTGFKPFECRVCLKRFFRKDHLMEHMITHSKQLPFQCPLCEKSFTRQVYFKAHLQTEHWNMPGDKQCSICGHKAVTIKGAKLHYTTRHAKAANTVNSSSPVNSRLLTEDLTTTSSSHVVTRSSLMSARLQTGPTLVTTEHHRSPSASDSESFPSLNLSSLDVSSSQLVYNPHLHSTQNSLLHGDPMTSLISPLSINSSGNEMSNDLGENLTYPLQMAPKLSIRSNLLSPSPRSSLRNPASPSITLHRIENNNGNSGGGGGRYSHGRKQKRPVQSCNGVSAMKMEPADDPRNADGRGGNSGGGSSSGSEDGSDEGPLVINHSFINFEAPSSSRNHSNACSPNSTLDLVKMKSFDSSPTANLGSIVGGSMGTGNGNNNGNSSSSTATTLIHHRHISTVGDLTITPLDTILVCVHCGIVFPDQTLYFLHKGVHSENNPWKCNICGELCRDKYDFNTHILSKAHQ